MPTLIDSARVQWSETSGDLTATVPDGIFGTIGSIGNDAAFGVDDTVGTTVAGTSSVVISRGMFYVWLSTSSLRVEVYINGAWRVNDATHETVLVVSDGTNVRVTNTSGGTHDFHIRRVVL